MAQSEEQRIILIGQDNEAKEKKEAFSLIQLVKRGKGHPSVWINPYTWLHPLPVTDSPEDTPTELVELLEKWRAKKDEMEEQYHPNWPSKLVSTKFIYQGEFYVIKPSDLGYRQELMECIQDDLDQDLYQLGCPYVRSEGFID